MNDEEEVGLHGLPIHRTDTGYFRFDNLAAHIKSKPIAHLNVQPFCNAFFNGNREPSFAVLFILIAVPVPINNLVFFLKRITPS